MSSDGHQNVYVATNQEKFFGDEFTGIALWGTGTVMERVLERVKVMDVN